MSEQRVKLLAKLDWYRGLGYDVSLISDETTDVELDAINTILQEKHRVDKLAALRDGLLSLFSFTMYTVLNAAQNPDIYACDN